MMRRALAQCELFEYIDKVSSVSGSVEGEDTMQGRGVEAVVELFDGLPF